MRYIDPLLVQLSFSKYDHINTMPSTQFCPLCDQDHVHTISGMKKPGGTDSSWRDTGAKIATKIKFIFGSKQLDG